jgi:glyoxylase-like metal-dependent hydrolase (beta-lactamase superfamily II)
MSHQHDNHEHDHPGGRRGHDRDHGHGHGHGHGEGHGSIGFAGSAAGGRVAHRLGRRRFLADLGRNTFAVALIGGFAVACSGDDDAESTGVVTAGSTATGAPPTVAPAPSSDASTGPTTSGAATSGSSTSVAPAADAADSLRWEQANFGFVSAYVLVRGNAAAIVDTGTAGNADRIGETLALLGVTFDDVLHVVLTHHHPDHVGSLPDVMARARSAATYAGEADIPTIGADGIVAVGDGDDVFGLQVIATPGHTPGSISLFDPGIGLLVAGDALNGNDDGTAISGPNAEFSADLATAEASVAKLQPLDVRAAAFGHGQPVRDGAGVLLQGLAAG